MLTPALADLLSGRWKDLLHLPDLASLRRQFAATPFLTFTDVNGLIRVNVATPQATAALYTQGAHLVDWTPAGQQPVIFVSRKSELAPRKAIRGGVPIVFPWFAADKKRDRIDGHPGPSHGYARLDEWTLRSATRRGPDVELVFALEPSTLSRSLGFNSFGLTMTFRIGAQLSMQLAVTNRGTAPVSFEDAFHTYYHVTDVHEATVHGLEPTSFIDKVDGFKTKPGEGAPVRFIGNVDRIYNNTTAPLTIYDGTNGRHILIEKSGSHSTVVWNPYKELPDLGPWEWHEFVAVESANIDPDTVTLAPGATATLGTTVSVQRAGTPGPSAG